ncbi:putative hydrolase, alpha/beta hydrolase family [Nocardia nova SH22a]|uniref:Putative hydrolase, alpha/beta hydrolase family n=1 Tax=Nocardia nova SH22a TaxID=1415166 RepID=W5TLH1_9NOCA|nr:alpha/beta fold hydrolase [Nocardia nova]AHH19808.1 putative hydrolase, alpha/beta hydrolase family [Nocardia nova SH22a]
MASRFDDSGRSHAGNSRPGGRSPLVLIAPAMAIGSGYYRPLVAEFAARGWEAKAMTRRGFETGRPRASRGLDWAYDDEIDDIATEVANARADHPDRPIILLGHSLGGQLAAGHELTRSPVDGLVTVGGALPYHRTYPLSGPHLLVMGAVIVPLLTALFGYLPQPAFGAPGARTMMREWARMVVTGRPPFPMESRIRTPSLVIGLDHDAMAPARSIDSFATRIFEASAVTRWHYRDDDVPAGASNDHIGWVRTSAPIVDRIVTWWETTSGTARAVVDRSRSVR